MKYDSERPGVAVGLIPMRAHCQRVGVNVTGRAARTWNHSASSEGAPSASCAAALLFKRYLTFSANSEDVSSIAIATNGNKVTSLRNGGTSRSLADRELVDGQQRVDPFIASD